MRPALLSLAFWAAWAQVGVFFVWALVSEPYRWQFTVYGLNLAALVPLWLWLRWERVPSPVSLLRPCVFLVGTLTLGLSQSSGEHYLLPLLAFANLVFVIGTRGTVSVVILTAATMGATSVWWFQHTPAAAVRTALNVVVTGVFVIGLAVAVLHARSKQREADDLLRQVRELTVAEERARMARDMHDSIGHHLTVIKTNLENAERLRFRDEESSWRQVSEAKSGSVAALADTRRWVKALRPLALADGVTTEVLRELAETLSGPNLLVSFTTDGPEAELEPALALALYRSVQEALTNVIRHSSASRVDIMLTITDATVAVTVTDNGYPSWPIEEGHGLIGLRERLEQHGGSLDVTAATDTPGLALTAKIPRRSLALGPELGATV